MFPIEQLQRCLRLMARAQYKTVELPPFELFFHPGDPLRYFNYAIPMGAVEAAGAAGGPGATGDATTEAVGLQPGWADAIRRVFAARGREPRFEFIEEAAPGLPALLAAAGFREESRQLGMVCTPASLQPDPPACPGLTLVPVRPDSPDGLVRTWLATQDRGFGGDGASVDTQRVADFRTRVHGDGACLALVDGEAAGAGWLSPPVAGLVELGGVSTRPEWRRRGIATALVGHLVRQAFAAGAEAVFLSAEDEAAGRVYAHRGFKACATMLAYAD
jgi:GNAT superfamily N-acetyltransferase